MASFISKNEILARSEIEKLGYSLTQKGRVFHITGGAGVDIKTTDLGTVNVRQLRYSTNYTDRNQHV